MQRSGLFLRAVFGLAVISVLASLAVLALQARLPGLEPAAPQALSSWRQNWDKPTYVFEEHFLPGEPAPPAEQSETALPTEAEPEPASAPAKAEEKQAQAPAEPESGFKAWLAGLFSKKEQAPAQPEDVKPELQPEPAPGPLPWPPRSALLEAPKPEPLTPKPELEKPVKPQRSPGSGKLALVIDDLGQETSAAERLLGLGAPVTLAVLPYLPASKSIDSLVARHNGKLILHQPMQPSRYPRLSPGPGAVLAGMDAEEIARVVNANLAQLPHAMGVNNHMGSLLTERRPEMAAALGVIKQRGVFFLDSLTSQESVGASEAKKLGLPFYRRDVFIDNKIAVSAILARLKQAETLALRNGQAVAIGHPHLETLRAIEIWLDERDSRVKLVYLDELTPAR